MIGSGEMAVLVAVVVTLIFVMVVDVVRQHRDEGGLLPSFGGRWVAPAVVGLMAVRRRVAARLPQQLGLGD